MRKISSVATGIPLKNTEPAAIEKYLQEKVRADLGEYHDLVQIKPVLRIDKEDGNLSGNVTDGFGAIILNVSGKSIHIPFIIHQKSLLPFDTIVMGEDQVTYDISKLRKLVIALDKHIKENTEGGTSTDTMEVAQGRDVPTHNGFLGTIMNIRDSHRNRDVNGIHPYEGDGFGDLDDARLMKRASSDDFMDTFHDIMEKISHVKVYTPSMVEETIRAIEKKAESESQEQIDDTSAVQIETAEKNRVQYSFAKIDKDKLVSMKRVFSGNNVVFPVFNDGMFEQRNGRVYHKLKDMADYPAKTQLKSVVLDAKGGYRLLRDADQFMASLREPIDSSPKTEQARGLTLKELYAFEIDKETVSLPFMPTNSYINDEEDNGMLISVPERGGRHNLLKASESTLFQDSLRCEQRTPVERKYSENEKDTFTDYGYFTLLISKSKRSGLQKMTRADVRNYILENAENEFDHRVSERIAGYGDTFYLVGSDFPFFKLESMIKGYFKTPDGLFKEGPFAKTAAYEGVNKASLILERDNKPRVYAVEWAYSGEVNVDGLSSNNIEKRRESGLNEVQARKVLDRLGYDERRKEQFFEIAHRNGRYAQFRLPSTDKAKSAAPKDAGKQKAAQAFKNIVNSTLNARNFVPVLEDVVADGVVASMNVTPSQKAQDVWKSWKEASFETAVGIEKTAETIRGQSWAELAMLTNLKHQLDKLAADISTGYVKDAEDVFIKTASLTPFIEKKAAELISFNRHQLLHVDHPIVQPSLIKQALNELDGLSRYAKAGEVFLDKEAFFGRAAKESIKQMDHTIRSLAAENNEVLKKYKTTLLYLRSLEKKGQGETSHAEEIRGELAEIKASIDSKANEIGDVAYEKGLQEGQIEDRNRMAMGTVGLPALAGLSYGYNDWKAE